MFDWSFESPRPGEVLVEDERLSRMAGDAFSSRVRMLGYEMGDSSVTIWQDVKIVRIPIYDSSNGRIVGCAIRLDNRGEISEAIQIYS